MALLYHYTSAEGLKGILESSCFWASDCRFLNDSSEFKLGFSKLKSALALYRDDLGVHFPDAWSIVEAMQQAKESNSIPFVASFSREGDLLSQWRGYNGGRGFSIGVDADWLEQNAQEQQFAMFPVRYNEEEQDKAINTAVNTLLDMLATASQDSASAHRAVVNWWDHAVKVALVCKDKNFSEEAEYRVVKVHRSWPYTTRVRSGSGGLIPYIDFRIDAKILNTAVTHPNNLGIAEIIIGPAYGEKQKLAVDALLSSRKMRFQVRLSDIPYVAH